jgi:cytohesin
MNCHTQGGRSALMRAAAGGHTDCVRALLEVGADTLAADNAGDTALTLASHEGHSDCVRLLVEAGADKDATTNVRII